MSKNLFLVAIMTVFMQLSMALPVSAQENPAVLVQKDIVIKYPVITTNNLAMSKLINEDIQKEADSLYKKFQDGEYISAGMNYEVTYEDENVVSVLLKYYGLPELRMAHGMNWETGLVYNKLTGERIPLAYYLQVESAKQLGEALSAGTIALYDGPRNQKLVYNANKAEVKRVSDNYILAGNGLIYLIYEPYELGPYSDGAMKLQFDANAVSMFNK
ncbi:MAG TPA: hypothetical protein IAB06_04430 [Candidatus Avacidaminococcus intestinavium]|uniref:Deacetylase PdaC domain-containing protein n=1 Tax=Candidatus Avacidaminococcus intestinavium TaxID=2840684 RepID=A0A9D1MPV1_9FIRM|nr:hypothetical protein [Candidatus Avacidaminococcus intestinavium]